MNFKKMNQNNTGEYSMEIESVVEDMQDSGLLFLSTRRHNRGLGVKEEKKSAPESGASNWNLISFLICLTSSNLSWGWPAVLYKGFWSAFFAHIVCTLLFVSLNCCIAEMISIFPFSGGTYGFARVTTGPYIGFLVGCFESFGSICYLLITMISLGQFISQITGQDRKYEPIYWFILYSICITSECLNRQSYYQLLNHIAFYIVMIYVFYLIISLQNIEVGKYLPANSIDSIYSNGVTDFFAVFPYCSFFFFGMEMIPLVSNEVKNPTKSMSTGMISITVMIIVFSFLFMFFYFCQYPSYPLNDLNYIQTHSLAFNSGFSNTFGIAEATATIFTSPLPLASTIIYFHVCCKQIKALSASKLFPALFASSPTTAATHGTSFPDNSSLFVFLFGFIVLIIGYCTNAVNVYSSMFYNLYAACLMGTYSTYLIIFISFLIFRRKYSSLERPFRNPLGSLSAYLGLFLTMLLLIPVIGYSSAEFIGLKIFLSFVGIMSLYYFFYAKQRQSFSEDEQKILFVVYLIKANQHKNHHRQFHHTRGYLSSISLLISRILRCCFPTSNSHRQHKHQDKVKIHPIALHHSHTPTASVCPSIYENHSNVESRRSSVRDFEDTFNWTAAHKDHAPVQSQQTESESMTMKSSLRQFNPPPLYDEKVDNDDEGNHDNNDVQSISSFRYQSSEKTNDLYTASSFRS